MLRPLIAIRVSVILLAFMLLYSNEDDTVKPVNIESLTRIVKQHGGYVKSYRYNDLDHTSLLGALSIPLCKQTSVLDDIVDFVKKIVDNNTACD
jgi:hypothetical protein